MGVTCFVAPTFLFGRFRPAGRVPFCLPKKEPMAQATLSCPFGAIHLEMPWGCVSDERLAERAFKVASPPGPPFTRAGHFGLPNRSGGQNQDLFPSYSRATRPYCHQNLLAYASILHRLVPAFLLSGVGVGSARQLPSRPGFAKVGGVIPAHFSTRFCIGRGPCSRGTKEQLS